MFQPSTRFAVINIHKPTGCTSHDVVARVRKILKTKKVGHLGTLDPMAEGVLPIAVGSATRLIEYFPTDKKYRAEVTLGKTTDTLDQEGEVLSEQSCKDLDLSALESILARFRGVIVQQVPLYSAVHVNGKKLYEIARAGQTAELPSRETTIHALSLVELTGAGTDHPVLTLDIHCSSGTYIRSLARDIGEALGCGAYMSALVRTGHGCFTLDTATTLEQLAETPDRELLNPLDYLVIPSVQVSDVVSIQRMRSGMAVNSAFSDQAEALMALDAEGRPICIARPKSGQIQPVKVFPEDL